ncbi:hypothetical protein QYE76_030604 [Lolium multiflorum]|uniref:Aminotransferase-like plant mobile domain-containing protein n=1 Tax=Lolium multiflorum TaxID=4521 RepID=A0AAD8QQ67_LOLMU|nr:hypothetical protein QYE76_030604 [Lolium multiflorum]
MPMWLPSRRRHRPSRRGPLAGAVRPSDVAGVAPSQRRHTCQLISSFRSKTSRGSGRLGLSRFARLDVWRRCHGRHTGLCGADATGATHPLKCGARARARPTLSSFSSLCFPAAAARLPFAPTKSTKESSDLSGQVLPPPFLKWGKLAHWCWLKALTVLDDRWSWGTAALAYYRQLDEACRRTGSGGIGGCMLLLSVWSWDRLSVGRPRVLTETPWPHHPHFPDREPTWAYLWDNVSEMTSDPMVMYRQYTAELDTLTAEQVEWEPYGSYYRIGAAMADLNHKCTEEVRFWRMRCPLICMWLVEHHQPQRVMRQFGLYQECPPLWQDTDKALHRLDRQRQRKITNWPVHHSGHIAAFQHCLEAARNASPEQIVPHDFTAFNNYLEWFHQNTRIELVKRAYREEILDDPIQFDEVGQSQHDTFARRGRSTSIASELNFVREEIQKTADECEIMWDQSHRDEKPVGPLRNFIKNTARKMRRLVNLLGCREGEIPTSSSSEEPQAYFQSIPPSKPHGAYQFKPRGKAPNRYTPEDYVNRGKKVVTEEDDGPPRRSALSKMRNDEPFSSDEEEEEEQEEQEQQEQQQQQPRQRTKRMAVRKPARTARRGRY